MLTANFFFRGKYSLFHIFDLFDIFYGYMGKIKPMKVVCLAAQDGS